MIRTVFTALLTLCLTASAAHAQEGAEEAKVRAALQAKLPKVPIDSVTRTPFPGIYEVVTSGEIVYTDTRAEFMMGGSLYDLRNAQPRNLTQDTQQKIAAKTITAAHDAAIKMVRGNGKRVIYTFEDPNCGYCRELYKELNKMNDITVYTFLLPVLSPDSADKSRAIWCARDRAKAWEQIMLKGALTETGKPCDTPLQRNAQIAQKLGIRGTPAIYLVNGQQLGGFVPAQQMEQALAALGR
jgi:thiol:disulfide interchange protein DsbC